MNIEEFKYLLFQFALRKSDLAIGNKMSNLKQARLNIQKNI